MPCSDLDQHVLKYFETQLEQTGSHSWSCAGCNHAYTALNKRVRQFEIKQKELEDALLANQRQTSSNTERLDAVEKDINEVKQASRKDREDVVKKATTKWSREMMERDSRKGNIVVYGLNEPPVSIKAGHERQARDKTITADLFDALRVEVQEEDVKYAVRVGKLTEAAATKPRPLKIGFRNQDVREQIFKNAKNLPSTPFHSVSIVPDLTDQQREDDKEIFEEAKKMNDEMSEEDAENFIYRCIGRRGERTIVKMRKTNKDKDKERNQNRNTTRSNTSRAVIEEEDREAEEEEEVGGGKRGREETEDPANLSPSQSQARKRANQDKSS